MDETKRGVISRGFTRMNANQEKEESSRQKAVSRRRKRLIKERGQAHLPDLELAIHDAENSRLKAIHVRQKALSIAVSGSGRRACPRSFVMSLSLIRG